jgi:hypothetical protein
MADLVVEDFSQQSGMPEQKAKQLKYAAKQVLKIEQEVRDEAAGYGIQVVEGVVQMPVSSEVASTEVLMSSESAE